jgi:hypothetical protein
LFDIKEWLTVTGLDIYYDQFIDGGIDKKVHLLGLKKDADGDLTVLKSILHDADIQIKPIHARTFLNALNDLN